MDAVRANQDITNRLRPIVEMSRDFAVRQHLRTGEALSMLDPDSAARYFLVQDAVQVRTPDRVRCRAVRENAADGDHAQPLAGAAHQLDVPGGESHLHHRPVQVQRAQRIKPVDGDRQESAGLVGVRRVRLEHHRLDTRALQGRGGNRPRDAAANNQCLHDEPLSSRLCAAAARCSLDSKILEYQDNYLECQDIIGVPSWPRLARRFRLTSARSTHSMKPRRTTWESTAPTCVVSMSCWSGAARHRAPSPTRSG